MCLRCTLLGCVSSYQIKILSNQINKQTRRFYTASSEHKVVQCFAEKQKQMNPWYITGFVDGEGCFMISILISNKTRVGWRVQIMFKIGLHEKDKARASRLEQIQAYFDVGGINKQGLQSFQFCVWSVKDLKVIADHFNKYPLEVCWGSPPSGAYMLACCSRGGGTPTQKTPWAEYNSAWVFEGSGPPTITTFDDRGSGATTTALAVVVAPHRFLAFQASVRYNLSKWTSNNGRAA